MRALTENACVVFEMVFSYSKNVSYLFTVHDPGNPIPTKIQMLHTGLENSIVYSFTT